MPWYDHANQLTARQLQVFRYFVQHTEEYGRPPTFRQMQLEFDCESPSAFASCIKALVAKGYLVASQSGPKQKHYRVAGVRWQAVDIQPQGEPNATL